MTTTQLTFRVSHCKHTNNLYGLRVDIDPTHSTELLISHSSSQTRNTITIFDLSPMDIQALGMSILQQAIQIQMESK